MQVTQEPLDPCQVALTIEVESDKVVHAVDRAYREFAKYVNVPGFRKGKAPMHVVRKQIPAEEIQKRATELIVEPAYREAIEQTAVEPYAVAKLEMEPLELAEIAEKPFTFKAVVPLRPSVELGNYRGLVVEKPKFELTDSDVDEQLDRLRQRAADYPIAERPSETGDLIVADVAVKTEGSEMSEPKPTMIEIGADNIPGFDERIVGLKSGETKTFHLTYPAEYHDEAVAGKEAEFTITVKEVRAKQVPELNDDLALKISHGRIETLDALKEDLRKDLERSLVESSESQAQNRLVDQVVNSATVKYPPVLLERELDSDVKELLTSIEKRGGTLDEYLASVGKTREELHAEYEQAADRRIQVGLVLGNIVDQESLALTPDDLNAAIAERAAEQGATPEVMRAYLQANAGLDAVRNRAQVKKVLDFLLENAVVKEKLVSPSGNGASSVTPEAAGSKAGVKKGAKKKASDE